MIKSLIFAAGLGMALVLSATAQVSNPYVGDLLSATGAITNQVGLTNAAGATNITGANIIKLKAGRGIMLYADITPQTGTSTSNLTFNLGVGPGLSTNQSGRVIGTATVTTTGTGLAPTVALNSNTNASGHIVAALYISPTNVDNAVTLTLNGFSNAATNAVPPVVNHVWWSFLGNP